MPTFVRSMLVALALVLTGCVSGPGTGGPPPMIGNPIIPGFNPDPSIVRVAEDYYLATSSFEYFPGVPIYHSRNLVNWELIGHALHRPEQLDLDGVRSTAGIYAPTLRYHDGTFYMVTTLVTPGRKGKRSGNFLVTAKDPRGPWSDPIWIEDADGIDPSLFFDDDGRVYYAGNMRPKVEVGRAHKMLWFSELDPETFQLVGERTILDSGPWLNGGLIGNAVAIEGPHVYKKDGRYYLLHAHGGTGMTHAESIWRGPTPLGPWTLGPANPIVTHRDQPNERWINATGHADLVHTSAGHWWMVLLGIRSKDDKNSPMGRETFLVPVDWSGDWPVVNPESERGRVPFALPAPDLPGIAPVSHDIADSFDASHLALHWSAIRTPRERWWDLSSKPGTLRLRARADDFDEYAQPSFLGVRVPQAQVTISVEMDFAPEKDGEAAGLAIMRGHDGDFTLVKERVDGAVRIAAYADKVLVGSLDWRAAFDGPIRLILTLDEFELDYAVETAGTGGPVTVGEDIDASMLGFQPSGRFTGSMTGPFAIARGRDSTNYATFDDFRLETGR